MLSLSLLRLPRDHPRWRHLDPYQAHQLLWTAFPDVPRGERPFLFSLDARADYHSLLVQSTRPADWAGLADDAEVRTKSFDPSGVAAGARMAFSLRANPTVDRLGYTDQTVRGKSGTEYLAAKRVGVGLDPEGTFRRMGRPGEHPTEPSAVAAWRWAELLAWLARRADAAGFAVEEAEPGPVVSRRVARGPRSGERAMTFHEVEFTGALRVADPAAFAHAVASGVGRGRAFGYGLLMARPT